MSVSVCYTVQLCPATYVLAIARNMFTSPHSSHLMICDCLADNSKVIGTDALCWLPLVCIKEGSHCNTVQFGGYELSLITIRTST